MYRIALRRLSNPNLPIRGEPQWERTDCVNGQRQLVKPPQMKTLTSLISTRNLREKKLVKSREVVYEGMWFYQYITYADHRTPQCLMDGTYMPTTVVAEGCGYIEVDTGHIWPHCSLLHACLWWGEYNGRFRFRLGSIVK